MRRTLTTLGFIVVFGCTQPTQASMPFPTPTVDLGLVNGTFDNTVEQARGLAHYAIAIKLQDNNLYTQRITRCRRIGARTFRCRFFAALIEEAKWAGKITVAVRPYRARWKARGTATTCITGQGCTRQRLRWRGVITPAGYYL